MKALLITEQGTKHTVDVRDADVGVVIRQDTRMTPPVRCFVFSTQHTLNEKVATFCEVASDFINPEGI